MFLDIDPGFGQMWQDNGLARLFGDHHHYVTVGTNIGRPDCAVPTLGLEWIPTVPPVVLAQWPHVPATGDAPFTTVASWRGPFDPVEHRDVTYGLRVHEFRAYHDLPLRSRGQFVAALDIDDADRADAQLLTEGGWQLESPQGLVADLAIVHAWKGDSEGNLVYRKTARNFNPVMATAGKVTVAEVEHLVEPGEIDPDQIHTPGIFVQRIVRYPSYEKRIEQRTVRKRGS